MHCENSAKQTAKESTATFAILLMSGRVPSGLTCAEPSVSRPPRRGLDAGAQRIGAGRQPCAHNDRGKVGWLRTDTGTPGCVVLLRAERSRQEIGKFRNMRGPVSRLRGPGTRGSGTRAGSPGNPKTAIGHQGGTELSILALSHGHPSQDSGGGATVTSGAGCSCCYSPSRHSDGAITSSQGSCG